MKNYCHLTKKELSFLSSIQSPIFDLDNRPLSRSVVIVINKHDQSVPFVYSLDWYKYKVKTNNIFPDRYRYELRSML